MMTTACQWWTDDDQLIAALSDALSQASAVPREFIKIAKAAYKRRTIDAGLANHICG